jgi:UDP-glucose 4-epimerase
MELGWKTVFTLDDCMKSAWEWEKQIRKPKG